MFKALTRFTIRTLVGVNVLVILLMMFIGNIDRFNPVELPLLANLGLGFPVLLVLNLLFLVLWICTKKRMIVLPFLGFLLCYFPIRTYMPFNLQREVPHGAIKVLSYNVYMFSNWDEPTDETNPIVDYIVKSKADIVCLQEALAGGSKKDKIYDVLKEHYPYFKKIVKKAPAADDIVLLSRFPVLWQDTIPYGSHSNQSVAYMLDIKGTKTLLVNNHFESNGLSSDDKESFKTLVKGRLKATEAKDESFHLIEKLGKVSQKRAPQAEMVARYVRKYLDKKVPVILCGDFNDGPLSYTHRTIGQELTDCFVASGNGLGISYNKSGMYFRIDHIFCSDDFEVYNATVDNSITTSDHYPIYCWLKYYPKP